MARRRTIVGVTRSPRSAASVAATGMPSRPASSVPVVSRTSGLRRVRPTVPPMVRSAEVTDRLFTTMTACHAAHLQPEGVGFEDVPRLASSKGHLLVATAASASDGRAPSAAFPSLAVRNAAEQRATDRQSVALRRTATTIASHRAQGEKAPSVELHGGVTHLVAIDAVLHDTRFQSHRPVPDRSLVGKVGEVHSVCPEHGDAATSSSAMMMGPHHPVTTIRRTTRALADHRDDAAASTDNVSDSGDDDNDLDEPQMPPPQRDAEAVADTSDAWDVDQVAKGPTSPHLASPIRRPSQSRRQSLLRDHDPRGAILAIRGSLTDLVFSEVCRELESNDRERSGQVHWRTFASSISRLCPGFPVRNRTDMTLLLRTLGLRMGPGRAVPFLEFFDRCAPTRDEAVAIHEGAAELGQVLARVPDSAERRRSVVMMVAAGDSSGKASSEDVIGALSGGGGDALRAKERGIHERLRLIEERPIRKTAVEVMRMMRDRALRSSASKAFRAMDSDRNGVLDRDELRAALRRLKIDMSPDETDRLMRMIDDNKDGLIQFDEWMAFVHDEQRTEAARGALGGVPSSPENKTGDDDLGPASRNNPPPAGALVDGNRRGLARNQQAVEMLQSVVAHHPEVVEAFPLTENACRALIRRLDAAATSFASTADFRTFLLREASRRLKPGVSATVTAEATAYAAVQARALPVIDPATGLGVVPGRPPPGEFPVSSSVRDAIEQLIALVDTNNDGFVQSDDLMAVAETLAVHTSAGHASVPILVGGMTQPDLKATAHPVLDSVRDCADSHTRALQGPAIVTDVWRVTRFDDEPSPRAPRSPRFDPTDVRDVRGLRNVLADSHTWGLNMWQPASFDELAARGARRAPGRFDTTRSILGRDTSHVVSPRTDVATSLSPRPDDPARFESATHAAMRAGMIDSQTDRVVRAHDESARKCQRHEQLYARVLESHRRWDDLVAMRRTMNMAKRRGDQMIMAEALRERRKQEEIAVTRPLRKQVAHASPRLDIAAPMLG